MKKIIFLLVLLNTWTAFAHEDSYISIDKSNIQIKVRVGYKNSLNVNIIESYAEIINSFTKEIDSAEKVFIQFEEDYCFHNYDLVFLAYGEFSKFLIPSGFPFGYKYDMDYINTQKGVSIIIAEQYFKLEPLLKLIEFGLHNKECVLSKGENFYKLEESLQKIETTTIIDSLLQSEPGSLIKKCLSTKVDFKNTPNTLTQKNVELFLKNDSIFFVDQNRDEILKLSSLYSIDYNSLTDCFFLLNTNYSFYFINQNLKSDQKQYDFTFKLRCIDRLTISYLESDSVYKIRKSGGRYVVIDFETKKEIGEECVYFDEKNGVYLTEEGCDM